mmetsp:Transcript_64832/g.154779  ORF Transcript_64832/g.154779 Transcript_64832/m.154779 type:complete len:234 (-) Transcript_64832:1369-2070(-)
MAHLRSSGACDGSNPRMAPRSDRRRRDAFCPLDASPALPGPDWPRSAGRPSAPSHGEETSSWAACSTSASVTCVTVVSRRDCGSPCKHFSMRRSRSVHSCFHTSPSPRLSVSAAGGRPSRCRAKASTSCGFIRQTRAHALSCDQKAASLTTSLLCTKASAFKVSPSRFRKASANLASTVMSFARPGLMIRTFPTCSAVSMTCGPMSHMPISDIATTPSNTTRSATRYSSGHSV